ncbi:alpha/beta hydrolase fold domain-containing protein [Pseudomonas putida]|uniref:alpha/beta hydrolase fold domain-containing protein n=1 Tax=Pseudomonas putida TaxID=303 RepID=UPI00383BA9B7
MQPRKQVAFERFPLTPEEHHREQTLREHFAHFWATASGPQRETYDRFIGATPLADGVHFEALQAAHVAGWWARPVDTTPGHVILYIHGGGYVQGSAWGYRHFASQLASRTQTSVLVIDYPLAPEAQVRQAADAVLAAWHWLLDQGHTRIAVVGDSAGGGLALALLARLAAEAQQPQPVAGVAFSPWADLSFSGPSMTDAKVVDPLIGHAYLQQCARQYLGDVDPRDPLASPLFADLDGLPPLLLQVGSDERLLDDACQFAERAQQAGVDARLELWEGLHHVFQLDVAHLASSRQALDRAGAFLRQALQAV